MNFFDFPQWVVKKYNLDPDTLNAKPVPPVQEEEEFDPASVGFTLEAPPKKPGRPKGSKNRGPAK